MQYSLRAVAPLLLVVSFVFPLFASAGTKGGGEWCLYGSECASNSCTWVTGSFFKCDAPVAASGAFGGGFSSGGIQVAGGSGGINVSYIQGYANSIVGIINGIIVPVLIAIAFLYFLSGVYKYFIRGADSKDKTDGRNFVVWSIIGFVVIFSVWGLVNIVAATLGLPSGGTPPAYPTL